MMQFHYVPSGEHQLATSVDLPQDADGQCPVVIAVHGLTGHRIGRSYLFVEFARMLNDHGIACVRFDQAGCGESTGRFRELTLPRMRNDLEAIRAWAHAQPWCDTKATSYLGMSLGALPAICADATYGSLGVALWAPVYDMGRVFANTARTGLRAILAGQGWVPYKGLAVGKTFVDQMQAIDTAKLLSQSAAPLLVFHCQGDDVVRIEESIAYEQRCTELHRPCEFVRFKGADHDFADYGARKTLLDRTIEFFREQLEAENVAAPGCANVASPGCAGAAGKRTERTERT